MSTVKDRILGTGDGVRVRCAFDDWEFSPRYTDGVCPLCGWRPEGVAETLPLVQRLDWFLVTLVVVLVASILMGILVIRAYMQA